MKVSVVTTTYNNLETLTKLYESLILQKDDIHEWIVCDDGSTDGTWQFLQEESKAERFPIHAYAQLNKGFRIAKNINNGLRSATGDIIFVVMADSYLNIDTIKTLKSEYIKGTAGSGMRINVKKDGTFHSFDHRNPTGEENRKLIGKVPFYWSFFVGNSMIIPRDALDVVGLWDEEYKGYGMEDYDYIFRLGQAGYQLIQYNKVIVNHFHHAGRDDSPDNVKRFTDKVMSKYGKETVGQWIQARGEDGMVYMPNVGTEI